MAKKWLNKVKWDDNGLVPVIVQEVGSNDVLMFAWMNREALALTAERFPSRTENRRYLIHQLELLKRAASEADDEFDAAWRRLHESE